MSTYSSFVSFVCSRLESDFEFNPAMCLQRNTVYCCYVEFCREKNISPANQAIFGKVRHFHISSGVSILLKGHLFPLLCGSMFCTICFQAPRSLVLLLLFSVKTSHAWSCSSTFASFFLLFPITVIVLPTHILLLFSLHLCTTSTYFPAQSLTFFPLLLFL